MVHSADQQTSPVSPIVTSFDAHEPSIDETISPTHSTKASPVKVRRSSRQCHLPRNSISGSIDLSVLGDDPCAPTSPGKVKKKRRKSKKEKVRDEVTGPQGSSLICVTSPTENEHNSPVANLDDQGEGVEKDVFVPRQKQTDFDMRQPGPKPAYRCGDRLRPNFLRQPFKTSIWSFLWPLDQCLLGCFLPNILYGRTNALMEDVPMDRDGCANVECMRYTAWSMACLGWPYAMEQRNAARTQYRLEGGAFTDCVLSFFCGPCSAVQVNKEASARHRRKPSHADCREYCDCDWPEVITDLGPEKNKKRMKFLEEHYAPIFKSPLFVAEYCQLLLIEARREAGLPVATAREEFQGIAPPGTDWWHHMDFVQWLQRDLTVEQNPLPQWCQDYWDTHEPDGVLREQWRYDPEWKLASTHKELSKFSFSTGLPLANPNIDRRLSCACTGCGCQKPLSIAEACKIRRLSEDPGRTQCGCSCGQLCTCINCHWKGSSASSSSRDDGYCAVPPLTLHKESGGSSMFPPAVPTPQNEEDNDDDFPLGFVDAQQQQSPYGQPQYEWRSHDDQTTPQSLAQSSTTAIAGSPPEFHQPTRQMTDGTKNQGLNKSTSHTSKKNKPAERAAKNAVTFEEGDERADVPDSDTQKFTGNYFGFSAPDPKPSTPKQISEKEDASSNLSKSPSKLKKSPERSKSAKRDTAALQQLPSGKSRRHWSSLFGGGSTKTVPFSPEPTTQERAPRPRTGTGEPVVRDFALGPFPSSPKSPAKAKDKEFTESNQAPKHCCCSKATNSTAGLHVVTDASECICARDCNCDQRQSGRNSKLNVRASMYGSGLPPDSSEKVYVLHEPDCDCAGCVEARSCSCEGNERLTCDGSCMKPKDKGKGREIDRYADGRRESTDVPVMLSPTKYTPPGSKGCGAPRCTGVCNVCVKQEPVGEIYVRGDPDDWASHGL